MRKQEHRQQEEHNKHDSNMKELVKPSVKKLIKLFYPELYDDLDDSQPVRPALRDHK